MIIFQPRKILRLGFYLLPMLLVGWNASAQFTYTTTNNQVTITGYSYSTVPFLTIPSTINNLPVVAIASNAFANFHNLSSVTIPTGVTNIGSNAFSGCSSLVSALFQGNAPTMGSSVFIFTSASFNVYYYIGATGFTTPTWTDSSGDSYSTIAESPFLFTTSGNQVIITGYMSGTVTTLVIPSAINGKTVVAIGANAFANYTSLTSVTIPGSVTSIGSEAFDGCTSLTGLTIPGSVTNIGTEAFYGCISLTSISIPNGVSAILTETFYGCTQLTTVTLPASVNRIDSYSFLGCTSLTSFTVDPANTTFSTSADGVLFDKNQDTLILYPQGKSGSYAVPNSVTTIGEYAFQQCVNLTSVMIPNGVTAINSEAFYGSSLTSVSIPASLISIADGTFYNCLSVTAFTVDPANTAYSSLNGVLFDESQATLLQYPAAKSGAYTIPASVVTIQYGAFIDCAGLTSVTIPNSVTSIGLAAFQNCTALTSLTLPSGITSIPYDIANGCTHLSSVTIPNSITTIGDYAFAGCSSLASVNIPNSVTLIQEEAFFNCSSLTHVTIPSSVNTLGDGVFAGCTGLISMTIPNTVTSMGVGMFQGCIGLTSVTLPANMTSIGDYMFYNCSHLTSVVIPSGVTRIGYMAFFICSSLTSVTIPAGVTSIGSYAFEECTQLTNALFLGNAPTMGTTEFLYTASNFKVSYFNGATGFTSPIWTDSSGSSWEAVKITKATFSQWEASYAITSAATASPLNDGVPNLLKYLFDINPTQAMNVTDRAALPTVGVSVLTIPPATTPATYLTLTYRQSPTETGITVYVQTSPDLQTWQTITPDRIQNVGTDTVTGDPLIQAQVKASQPSAKEFIRLNVTMP